MKKNKSKKPAISIILVIALLFLVTIVILTGKNTLKEKPFESYPEEITVDSWENKNEPLESKTLEEILDGKTPEEFAYAGSETLGEIIIKNYQDYGDLASHYLPEEYITGLEEFDTDMDGIDEIIVSYKPTDFGSADWSKADIVKEGVIIFTGQSRIKKADDSNGFYLEMGGYEFIKDTGNCCPTGFYKVRFIYDEGKFKPVSQEKVWLNNLNNFTEGLYIVDSEESNESRLIRINKINGDYIELEFEYNSGKSEKVYVYEIKGEVKKNQLFAENIVSSHGTDTSDFLIRFNADETIIIDGNIFRKLSQ